MTHELAPSCTKGGLEDQSVDSTAPIVRVSNLVKHFRRQDGSEVRAVNDVSIEVAPGKFTVLLGPSGCGKTTLLRCVAGLENPMAGRVEIRGRTVFDSVNSINVPPEGRGLNMIFQSYALWPHMTAFGNVAYPLRCQKVKRSEIASRVERTLSLVGIAELSRSYPNQMSGGQQQRVALARALVSNSDLVLFDEPLSNVDAKVREQLRYELMSMQHELGFAALYVTHDQTEAMELANDIVVLESGRIAQGGSPQEIYSEPKSRYVADFVGTINELEGTLRELTPGGGGQVETPVGHLRAGAIVRGINVGDKVAVVCRPERVALSMSEIRVENSWEATVRAVVFSGARTEHVVEFGSTKPFRIWHSDIDPIPSGTAVRIGVAAKDLRVIPWGQDSESHE